MTRVAFDDQWFSGLQTAVTGVATAVAGAVGAWFALRRKVSNDTTDIKRAAMETGWLERLVKEREELLQRIESLRESQLNDARANARLEAECKACHERVEEAHVERDNAAEASQEAQRRRAAAEERIVMLTDEVLDLKIANGRLFKELAAIDRNAAERVLQQHLKPEGSPT